MGRAYITTGIQLTDASGSTVVDSTGIVSETQFIASGTFGTTEFSTTGTAFSDISGGSLVTPSFDRNTNLLFLYGAIAYAQDIGYPQISVALNVDGTTYRPWIVWTGGTLVVNDTLTHQTAFRSLSLGTGVHTAKLQFKVNSGATGYADQVSLQYLQLGK